MLNNNPDPRPFTVREALGAGVSRHALRSASLVSPFRGIRSSTPLETIRERGEAYGALMATGTAFSHSTAAIFWGMWLPRRLEIGPLHVVAELPTRAPRMTGIIGHKAEAGSIETRLVSGLQVVSPLDAWRQLATLLTLEELVAAGDSLLRRQSPLLQRHQLVVALARHGNHRGAKKLRAAYEKVRQGCDSARETRLRLLLAEAGLPEPVVNALVSRPGDPRRYGDLVYRRWKVIVEYDGMHHREPWQIERDILRLEQLAADGWTVIRVVNEHLKDPQAIVARVTAALRAHGWQG